MPPSDFSGRSGPVRHEHRHAAGDQRMAGDHRLAREQLAGALGALLGLGEQRVQRRAGREVLGLGPHRAERGEGGARVGVVRRRAARGRARQERRLRRLAETAGAGRADGRLGRRRGRLARLAARGAWAGCGVCAPMQRPSVARTVRRRRSCRRHANPRASRISGGGAWGEYGLGRSRVKSGCKIRERLLATCAPRRAATNIHSLPADLLSPASH